MSDHHAHNLQEDMHEPIQDTMQEESRPPRVPLAEFQNTTRMVARDVNLYVYRVENHQVSGLALKDPLKPPLRSKDFLRLGDGIYKVDIRHPETGKPVYPNSILVQVQGDTVTQIDHLPESPAPQPPDPTPPSFPLPDNVVILPANLMERFLNLLQNPSPPPPQPSGHGMEVLSTFSAYLKDLLALQSEMQRLSMESVRMQVESLKQQLQSMQQEPDEDDQNGFLSFLQSLLEHHTENDLASLIASMQPVFQEEFGEEIAKKLSDPAFLSKLIQVLRKGES